MIFTAGKNALLSNNRGDTGIPRTACGVRFAREIITPGYEKTRTQG
jgi:hypothetical protein